MTNFSKNLKALRKANRFTQKELADKLGVSHQAIASWEGGLREPSLDQILKIADIFGVDDLNLLIKGEFNSNNANNIYLTSEQKDALLVLLGVKK